MGTHGGGPKVAHHVIVKGSEANGPLCIFLHHWKPWRCELCKSALTTIIWDTKLCFMWIPNVLLKCSELVCHTFSASELEIFLWCWATILASIQYLDPVSDRVKKVVCGAVLAVPTLSYGQYISMWKFHAFIFHFKTVNYWAGFISGQIWPSHGHPSTVIN